MIIKSTDSDQAPKGLKIFKNRSPLDFDDIDQIPADQELELTEQELAGEEIILEYVKFQAINNLTVSFDQITKLDLH